MHLDDHEIRQLAESLAPLVANELERRFSERPEWAFSIPEAASWAKVPEDSIRHAIKTGKLPCVRVGRSVRIKRSDLFGMNGEGK